MKFIGNKQDDYISSPMSEYPLGAKLLLGVVVVLLGAITKIYFRWKIDGKDSLGPDQQGKGRVIIMNHVSFLDPIIAVISMHFHGHPVRPIYKSEFDRIKILGWFLTRVGGIPVKRGSADMRAIRAASRALQSGECVLIYPEGTRVKHDEDPREIHSGFSLIAQMAEADIVPSAIVGAADIVPTKHHFPMPVKVWIRVGEAIHVGKIERKERKEKLAQIEERAVNAMFSIRDELRREHPGRT